MKRIIVQPGDTLWALCQHHLGDPYKWARVADLNGIQNANLIRPGQVLLMPEQQELKMVRR